MLRSFSRFTEWAWTKTRSPRSWAAFARCPFEFSFPAGPIPSKSEGRGESGGAGTPTTGTKIDFDSELIRTEGILLDLLRDVEAAHGLRPRARFLLGFSQGGYCGAFAALRHPEVFRGMIICGARVKTEFLEDAMPKAAARDFRVLLCHGRRDTAVSFESAERGRDALRQAGIDVELAEFDAGHSLGRAQVEAAAQWIQRIVSPPRSSDASEQPPIHR